MARFANRWTAVSIFAFALVLLVARTGRADAVAFFYGKPIPLDELRAFNRLVVDADNVDDDGALLRAGPSIFAYVSIGEADPARPGTDPIDPRWVLGKNIGWGSSVIDLRRTEWRDLLLEKRIAPLHRRGYRGLFLDTLDSYSAFATSAPAQAAQVAALASILESIHARFPDMQLLLNRGFEVLPRVAPFAAGVVAESLFRGWDPKTKQYVAVPKTDRTWLLARLREVRDQYHLPVTVIDYVPPGERKVARKVAGDIAALGFAPWVAQAGLDRLGVGELEPFPRRVLVVYDRAEAGELEFSSAHRLLAPILEYLGLAIDYADAREPLPDGVLANRYAGIVTWFSDDVLPEAARYRAWLESQLDSRVPVAILGQIGIPVDATLLRRLGVAVADRSLERPFVVQQRAEWIGFDLGVTPFAGEPVAWRTDRSDLKVALSLVDANGERIDPVAFAPWGGFALEPFVTRDVTDGTARWVIDPFAFVQGALGLEPFPAPDLTTENGRRLLTIHIDGDGFVSRAEFPGAPLAGRVVLDRILRKYRLPTTASVIEGEVGPRGLHPDLSAEAEAAAREIFALPYVEIASHTFSHPFQWKDAEHDDPKQRLPIPGYRFDLSREIEGTVEYIRTRLAPAGKPVRGFLWSGNALPSSRAIQMTRALGLYNVNGGDTTITTDRPSVALVSPALRTVDGQIQVYAPIQNENLYTNLWHGPYYGFRRVIETFRLTDAPRRLKPISIYYHFYSGTKRASLVALEEVYRWALDQEMIPLPLSEYAAAAEAFDGVRLYRHLDGAWELRGLGALRTVRIPPSMGWPDPARSDGVVAVRDLPQGRYVSFGPGGRALLALSDTEQGPLLQQCNARVMLWEQRGDAIRLRLRGHVPVRIVVGGLESRCAMVGPVRSVRSGHAGAWAFDFASEDTGDAELSCQ